MTVKELMDALSTVDPNLPMRMEVNEGSDAEPQTWRLNVNGITLEHIAPGHSEVVLR